MPTLAAPPQLIVFEPMNRTIRPLVATRVPISQSIMTAENPEWRQNCLPGAVGRESSGSLLKDFDKLQSRTERLLGERK